MTKEEIQQHLGADYVVTQIIEDENELFAFYVSKKFHDTNGNDNYALIGVGPFYFNKKTNEKKLLGAFEFHEEYFDRKLIQDNIQSEDIKPDLNEVIENIKQRKHINDDEFEIIMTSLNIDMYSVTISSDDFIHETIESPNSEDIDKFCLVFEKAQMKFKRETAHKIILKNEEI